MVAVIPLVLIASMAEALPPAPAGHRWEKFRELSDDFSGNKLDSGKWVPRHPYWKGRQPSRFAETNVLVRHGQLELRTTTNLSDLSEVKDPTRDVWVQAACVTSRDPVAFYGYYESRLRASRLSATSSFWLQGKTTEIDVAEELGVPAKGAWRSDYMLMDLHFFTGDPKQDFHTPARARMRSGASDQFHVYGVWWKDKSSVVFYLDGKEVARSTPKSDFVEPMYLFFDTEIFQDAGLPDIGSLKDDRRNTMYVDWVHSWKLVPANK